MSIGLALRLSPLMRLPADDLLLLLLLLALRREALLERGGNFADGC